MSMEPVSGRAGWLQDPSGRYDQRYWDGTGWTTAVMRGAETDTDPEPPPAGAVATVVAPPAPPSAPVGPPPSATDRLTSLPPNETQERISFQLAAAGFQPTQVSQGRIDAVLVTKKKPNMLLLILLLLFWIIPGVIYYMMASGSKKHPVTLFFTRNGPGTRVSVQGDSQAFQALAPAMAQLPW